MVWLYCLHGLVSDTKESANENLTDPILEVSV